MECIFPFKTFPWALGGSPLTSLSHQSTCWQKVASKSAFHWRLGNCLRALAALSASQSIWELETIGRTEWFSQYF
eukprot:7803954-Ditylum_brightwellii.AAC.1